MKKQMKLLGVWLVVLCLKLSITGCGDDGTQAYAEEFTDLATEISQENTDWQKLLNGADYESQDWINSVQSKLSEMEASWTKLGSLKAPKKMEDIQSSFKGASDKMLSAIALYKECFKAPIDPNNIDEAGLNALVDKAGEADAMAMEASSLMLEGSQKATDMIKK